MATDVKARLTNTGISAQKVRLVIDMVRGNILLKKITKTILQNIYYTQN